MILMFSGDNRSFCWRAVRRGRVIRGRRRLDSGLRLDDIGDCADCPEELEAVGYFLHHGGSRITKPAVLLTPQNFNEAAKCVRFLPDYNDLTFKIAGYWMKKRPDVPHVLLCDTAFFNLLPYAARNYAIPYRLQRENIRRYGRYGLSQRWLLKQIKPRLAGHQSKIITVYLGDCTSVSAIKDGNPLATSSGFTPVEGILSLTGSGSIDPTIVFYLHAAGMSFSEINELLSKKSGFAALVGRSADVASVLNNRREPKKIAARGFYCYNVVKWIGSAMAILGGADAIVFFSEKPAAYRGIIREICRRFAFLGLKCKCPQNAKMDFANLTGDASRIKAFCFRHDRWRIMEEDIRAIILKRREA
ncbi:MAG: hypothetical protein PHP98_10675 [Kiritimatiellae bacterium]|nr:hypothetical protein [Kiritimatiellia bacterium]